MQQYSWLSNFLYCLHDNYLNKKLSIFAMFAEVVSTLGTAVLGTLTTYYVVLSLTSGDSATTYLFLIGMLSLGTLASALLQVWSSNYYLWYSTFARCTVSWQRMTEKSITADYLNVEPRDKRTIFTEGYHAMDSNWVGLEQEMKQGSPILIGLVGMLSYAIIAAIYVPWILLVMVPMAVASFLLSRYAYHYVMKHQEELNRDTDRAWELGRDGTDIIKAKDIRAYRLDHWFGRIYDFYIQKIFTTTRAMARPVFIGHLSDTAFLLIRDLVAYSVLIAMLARGEITLASFTFLLGITAGFSTWVNTFTDAFSVIRTNSPFVTNYRNAVNLEDTMNHGKGLDIKSLQKPFEIAFNHVCFSYPGSTEDTLHDINLVIHPGEKIALVGNNGAGKTTLIKLLCGLYKPRSGTITLNGHDIQEFNIDDYMSLISALFQDVKPLALTMKANITCSMTECDDARYQRALELSGFKARMESLPAKDETYYSQEFDLSGVTLSGGETQKLLLARALYKDAPLLVLDEPTAALDPLSEQDMYQKYQSFSKGNTSIFISHRLASTRFCDRIVYLDNGRIEEIGTHEELLANKKKYAEMFALQAKYYQEGGDENATL